MNRDTSILLYRRWCGNATPTQPHCHEGGAGWEPEISTIAIELTAFLHNNTKHFDAAPYLDPFEASRVEVVATFDPAVESVSLLDVFSYTQVSTFAPPFWAQNPPPSPPSPPPPVPAGKSFQVSCPCALQRCTSCESDE